ncbi:MAG TPA: dihydroorotate dehydrogenase electron transfer subunit [Candidatus Dormibacteraeota bacterium]
MTLATSLQSDLGRARDERGEVVSVERLEGGIVELTVRVPHLAADARPGEFAQLRCAAGIVPLLRRPMSVAWIEDDCCSFVFEVVGEGTARLAALRGGDRLDVLGPLGAGFTLPRAGGTLLCVSGGLGCAPFPLLASRAVAAGARRVVVLSGAATAARLYPAARFARGAARVEVREATDDGSRGHYGRVTEMVLDALAEAPDVLAACGPNPMLATLAGVLERAADPPRLCEASLEAPMGCGFGTCLGCALPVRADGAAAEPAWALCCRDGPVMAMERVDWAALRALPPASVA